MQLEFTNDLVKEKLKRKKRQSVSIVLVLLISLSFAIMSQSLITSLQKTNREYRESLYGEWICRVVNAPKGFGKLISEMLGIEYYGTMDVLGKVQGIYGLGYIDENMITAGRFSLVDGRWPEQENEVVLSEDCLRNLGYRKELGQEIVLNVELMKSGGESVNINRCFTLCGILKEYADIWANGAGENFASIIVAEKTANNIYEVIGTRCEVSRQFFLVPTSEVISDNEKMDSMDKKLIQIAADIKEEFGTRPIFERNQPLFLGWMEELENNLYIRLIAIVCFVAILCTYFLRIQEEIQYCATLRSMGMSMPQLAEMSILECAYMLFPATLLGVPIGAGLTWIGMKTLLKSGISQFYLEIPYGKIGILILLWFAITFLARIFVTIIALNIPLTVKIQIHPIKKKILVQVKNIFVIIVLGISVYMVFNSTIGQREATVNLTKYEAQPHYRISANDFSDDECHPKTVADEYIRTIRNIRDIEETLSYSYADVGISIESMPGRRAQMVIVNAEELESWNKILHLNTEEKELFTSGEMGIICFPDERIDPSHLYLDQAYLLPGETLENRIYPKIEKPVTITLYNVDREIVAKKTMPVKVEYLSYEADYAFNGVELHSAYTIICSDQMIEELLTLSSESILWTPPYQEGNLEMIDWKIVSYGGNQGIGYRNVEVWANRFGNFESLDIKLAELCNEYGYELENDRTRNMALVQEQFQKVIRIIVVGVCIGLLAFLIYVGIVSLEVQSQKKHYRLLWALGMSKKDIFFKELWQATVRTVIAIFFGGIFFIYEKLKMIILQAQYTVGIYDEPLQLSYPQAWECLMSQWNYCSIRFDTIGYEIGGIFIFILIITIFIKKELWKGEMTL